MIEDEWLIYHVGNYDVRRSLKHKGGYELCKLANSGTHCVVIGYYRPSSKEQAIADADRLHSYEQARTR